MSITAEQVREAIEENTWAETGTIRQFEDSSWQAIADELNATLGSKPKPPCGGGYCPMCSATQIAGKGGEAMSMLSNQANELREMANKLGFNGVSTGDIAKLVPMLREAADTIESLSDKLQGVMGTRYCELFGTPERAARTICRQLKHGNICVCDGCPVKPPNRECDNEYDALLEWLKGESDGE